MDTRGEELPGAHRGRGHRRAAADVDDGAIVLLFPHPWEIRCATRRYTSYRLLAGAQFNVHLHRSLRPRAMRRSCVAAVVGDREGARYVAGHEEDSRLAARRVRGVVPAH